MTLDDILEDIHAMEEDLRTFERKYGVLSETFYRSYSAGEEPADDTWVADWAAWAGTYEIYLDRRERFLSEIQALEVQTPVLSDVIKRTSRHEPIPVPA